MKIHNLKTWPEFYKAAQAGEKRFEVRHDDGRNFARGDMVVLMEYEPHEGVYTGAASCYMIPRIWQLDGLEYLMRDLSVGHLVAFEIAPVADCLWP